MSYLIQIARNWTYYISSIHSCYFYCLWTSWINWMNRMGLYRYRCWLWNCRLGFTTGIDWMRSISTTIFKSIYLIRSTIQVYAEISYVTIKWWIELVLSNINEIFRSNEMVNILELYFCLSSSILNVSKSFSFSSGVSEINVVPFINLISHCSNLFDIWITMIYQISVRICTEFQASLFSCSIGFNLYG